MLSDLIIPPWAKLAIKFAPYIIIALLAASVAFLNNQLHHKKQELAVERSQRLELSKLVGAEDNWPSIRTHARDLKQSVDNLLGTFDRISKETLAAKARADAADAALLREQAENQKRYAAVQHTIDQLEKQASSGNVAIDDQVIEEISKLPFLGWRGSTKVFTHHNEELRYDYTHMVTPLEYNQRVIQLVSHPSHQELQADYMRRYKLTQQDLGNIDILAYAVLERNDHICEIHVVDPKVEWSSDARNTLGHELAHCFYGYWHGVVK